MGKGERREREVGGEAKGRVGGLEGPPFRVGIGPLERVNPALV